MDNQTFLKVALDQLKWEEYRRSYANVGDLQKLKEKIFLIRKGEFPFEFSITELNILKVSAQHSIGKIINYDYGPGFTPNQSQTLRDDAVNPLYEFAVMINKLMGNES